jgi:hypothetical protein
MKKIILITALTVIFLPAASQDNVTNEKLYRHEFGLDATGFVRQFLNLNTNTEIYIPTYYLTYRRYLKSGNIRAGIGATYSYNDNIDPNNVNVKKLEYISYSLNARIGWEFIKELSERWQIFYGMDIRPDYLYTKNDRMFQNNGIASGSEVKTQQFGVAPLLGFRFKLNDRLSILSESSFSIVMQKSKQKNYFTALPGINQNIPDNTFSTVNRIYSGFSQLQNIHIVFKI